VNVLLWFTWVKFPPATYDLTIIPSDIVATMKDK